MELVRFDLRSIFYRKGGAIVIILNLIDGSYHNYRKPNEEIKYVSSDHPASITKEIPRSVAKSLNYILIIESYIYDKKCLKNSEYKNLSCNINNRKKTIKIKIKEKATLFGSTHYRASR